MRCEALSAGRQYIDRLACRTMYVIGKPWNGSSARRLMSFALLLSHRQDSCASNPAFTLHAVTPGRGADLTASDYGASGHEFWPGDLPVADAFPDAILRAGHCQITHAYLLALAAAHEESWRRSIAESSLSKALLARIRDCHCWSVSATALLPDVARSRAHPVGHRYRRRSHRGGIAGDRERLGECEDAAVLAVVRILEPVAEQRIHVDRD
jgi:hypothetical protein